MILTKAVVDMSKIGESFGSCFECGDHSPWNRVFPRVTWRYEETKVES